LPASSLGERIAEARKTQGLTQRQLAAEIGMETMSISRIERGVRQPPLRRLQAIAAALQVPVSQLLGEQASAREGVGA
jgi:transcriptional regulator with XRE-family HTH domain